MNGVEFVDFRMEEHADRNSDGLHIAIGSFAFYLSLSGLNIVDDGVLDDGEFEIVPFSIPLCR